MRPLTDNTHKSLLPLNKHENFLSRILHQLNEYEISKVIVVAGYRAEEIMQVVNEYQLNTEVVINEKYRQDTNIYSMKLALDKVNIHEPVVVLEADIYLDDLAMRDIIFESQQDRSIWFTKNKFNKDQYGGILHCDENNTIRDIKIVPSFHSKYLGYHKLLGIMTIGSAELQLFKDLVNKYADETIEQYYLIPWIENLNLLPCLACDLGEYLVESVNRPEEYHLFVNYLESRHSVSHEIKLIDPQLLLDIEEYIQERKDLLKEKILKEAIWTKPIIIEKKHKLVLDGHHRFNIAKELNLSKIPVIEVDYADIEIWSLKKDQEVDKNLIISRAKKYNIYPNKTVKHKFDFKVPSCSYTLSELSS
jgi:CTP:phosphocholine cytidylyltransferase-like protein